MTTAPADIPAPGAAAPAVPAPALATPETPPVAPLAAVPVTPPGAPAVPPTTPAPAPAPAADDSFTTGAKPPEAPAAVTPDWPDDWRTKMAGGNEKFLKQLERFGSPADVAKSLQAAQQKISSGEYKKTLPENPSPEQLASYRKDNGIPETPDKYDLTLSDGLVIGEADKPIIDQFTKDMHAANASNDMVKSAVSSYYKILEKGRADAAAVDDARWSKENDALRAEWGNDYRRNQNIIKNYLSTLPDDFRTKLEGARLADGSKLLASADGVKYVMSIAMDKNPTATVLPHSSNPGVDINAEIAAMDKRMGSAEWAKDKAGQARYVQLVAARDAMGR